MIDTAEIKARSADRPWSQMAQDVRDLCDEVNRLRALIESSRNICSRSGGCIPRD